VFLSYSYHRLRIAHSVRRLVPSFAQAAVSQEEKRGSIFEPELSAATFSQKRRVDDFALDLLDIGDTSDIIQNKPNADLTLKIWKVSV
jgi:hypothetical protein